ncbi:hypothetical protein J7U46_20850 [Pelomonas sp. V22]|uniref:hypothetical protein n=1 Tax=Pelomonas sp. V22 TaxID=2822139 RepID=UPI0024A81EAB|nr:hypothetical protein [Pelomonas sp. V22]MDI4635525.1 hypothetical protein [Pelomonas sp. V22]
MTASDSVSGEPVQNILTAAPTPIKAGSPPANPDTPPSVIAEACRFIKQANAAGLPAIPIDPTLLKPKVDPLYWLDQDSLETAIEHHWQQNQNDRVGHLVESSHLVATATTGAADDGLHGLCERHGIEPLLLILGKGGVTMFFKRASTRSLRQFPASSELKVMKSGEIALLHPQGHCEFAATSVEVNQQFEEDLLALAMQLAGSSEVEARSTAADTKEVDPLARYSLTGTSATLRERVQALGEAIGGFAHLGQCTALYAAPNCGKTLLVLHAIEAAIRTGFIAAGKVYYFNMDDNSEGLLVKVLIAERLGFHMIAEGHQGFSSSEFLAVLQQLIHSPHAMGMVLILDTVKKLTDLMDKRSMVAFTAEIRRFVLRGGTVIALAHTNKHVGANGSPVYAGTSDMVDDFDCAWTMQALPAGADSNARLVSMKNFKRRGPLPDSLVYSYAVSSDYTELLGSVRQVPEAELAQVEQQAQMAADADLIEIVIATILKGKTNRMELVAEARKEAQVSRREVLRVLDAYRGSDPDRHRWDFTVIAKGAKTYRLIGAAETY